MDFCLNFADERLRTGCLLKELHIPPFIERFNSYFGKVLLMNFASTWIKLFQHWISVEFLLMEGYVQGALRKELLMAPSIKCFKTATLGRSYRCILPVLETIFKNIAFLLNFCWWKVMYRVLYERSCTLLLLQSALK